MLEEEHDLTRLSCRIIITFFLIFLISDQIVEGINLQTDRGVLLDLKSFLEHNNQINRGIYAEWNESIFSPCNWPRIACSNGTGTGRVTGINLSDENISGEIFGNFSLLTQLTDLDLSQNAISGQIPPDLNLCKNLRYLNLSHNILDGELNLTGLTSLETLDLTLNRFDGGIQYNFPAICSRLVTLNLSSNNFTGEIGNSFDECLNLKFVDLSSNQFTGSVWLGFRRLREFSVSDNNFTGELFPSLFAKSCSLEVLDLSGNNFSGLVPENISNCNNLTWLNLWGNEFYGKIPRELGLLSNLQTLFLGKNDFSREIPESLLNCTKLEFLDLSKNGFVGKVQQIFGRFVQIKFLVLHGNSYTGGIISSGILRLPNIVRLDLSFNNFTGPLPIQISEMKTLKFLVLAYNNFSGKIPSEFGNLSSLQALDLSFNNLNGTIPSTIGNMTSLLWLMLANNNLIGEIPPEIGNCNSLLWLNLANNQFSGQIPAEISRIGHDPSQTFNANRQDDGVTAGSGECLAMRRWIPESYPPFSFVYSLLTRKSCRSIWDRVLKGYGIFPICRNSSNIRTLEMSGYIQLTGNQFSGQIPPEIGNMLNFSLLHLGINQLSGNLTPEISEMPLAFLNVSFNKFSGEIPPELGDIKCLQSLDLSYNNFSGPFPGNILNKLTELNKFNVSYNPLLTGTIPNIGQMATFENNSFIGNPLLSFGVAKVRSPPELPRSGRVGKNPARMKAGLVFMVLTIAFLISGVLCFIICAFVRNPSVSVAVLLEDSKHRHDDVASSSGGSTISDAVKVFRLDKTPFTYDDILTATGNFSDDMVLGKGGFGTVYRGVLPDGRVVAVKKLQREGIEGEREFRAEMEVLCGDGVGWPHPNLVRLFGWCLFGSEKLLVYEYMEGGSLEDLLSDWNKLGWRNRIHVAVGVARALVFLHHECFPPVVHRDVKASNVLLDKEGKARVTDFGLARVVSPGDSHVSTIIAGTIGYVAPEYGRTWRATTKGDVYSFGVLAMELATGKRAVDGGDECLVEWVRRVAGEGHQGLKGAVVPVMISGVGVAGMEFSGDQTNGLWEMCELLRIGVRCTVDLPQSRPNMKEVLVMLLRIVGNYGESPPFI
ncbi:leucine-rich repeat protein kinase family protein [Tasmannia lanceolata]|uniref:leucine-rich repeat protein kinase family protein n=1 Tax=Tasmannia lanceolata TaxID=3420 RepID=UPI0040634038